MIERDTGDVEHMFALCCRGPSHTLRTAKPRDRDVRPQRPVGDRSAERGRRRTVDPFAQPQLVEPVDVEADESRLPRRRPGDEIPHADSDRRSAQRVGECDVEVLLRG